MPSIKARAFQKVFERTLDKGGRMTQKDVDALAKAAKAIADAREKAAALEVVGLVKHDRILDTDEVEPARKALGRMLGVDDKHLPPELERALTHAVPVPNVRVKSYDLTFDFSKDGDDFPARALITLDAAAPKTCVLEVDPDRLIIDEVHAGGRAVPFEVRDGRIFVKAAGEKKLDVRYRVKPTDDVDGYGLIRDKHTGRMWTLTWPYNTGALFPSSSRPVDGSTARVTLRVKDGEKAIGPGSVQPDGAFHLDKEVPAYAIGFSTGKIGDLPMSTRGGMNARTVALGAQVPESVRKEVREAVAQSLAFFAQWLGHYRYGNTMNVVEIKSAYGGMEQGGALEIGVGQSRADTVEAAVHETAHHWFGDGVRIAHWGELWMSEGFTNYATWRFFEHRDGRAAFYGYLDEAKRQLKEQLDQGIRQPLEQPSSTDPQEGLSWVPYMQGAWMLRMIEMQLGTPKMDALLSAWFRREQGSAVTQADFVAFAKKETGVDLRPFFDAWAKLDRVPTFKDHSKVDGDAVALDLRATTDVPAGIRVPVVVHGRGQTREILVTPGEETRVDVGFAVTKLEWDPNRTVLCNVR